MYILLGRINKIQEIDNRLFVLDKSISKSVLVFDRKGTFLFRVGKLGQGLGEYASVSDFSIISIKGSSMLSLSIKCYSCLIFRRLFLKEKALRLMKVKYGIPNVGLRPFAVYLLVYWVS